jgi:hypothetical protein
MNGELSLGGPDPSRYIGNITFVNVTSIAPYSSYWGIDIEAIACDEGINRTVLSNSASAIVDTVRNDFLISTYFLLKSSNHRVRR